MSRVERTCFEPGKRCCCIAASLDLLIRAEPRLAAGTSCKADRPRGVVRPEILAGPFTKAVQGRPFRGAAPRLGGGGVGATPGTTDSRPSFAVDSLAVNVCP